MTAGLRTEWPADGVAELVIDRPQARNALSAEVLEALPGALERAVGSGAGACVLRGEGSHFSAGGDLGDFEELTGAGARRAQMRRSYAAFLAVEDSPVPVVAAVDGVAYGGGTELALACDVALASTRARFRLPEISLGLLPGYGLDRAARAVGPRRAAWLALSEDPIDAATAHDWGLVQEVVEPDGLRAAAVALAARLAGLPGPAVRAMKRLLQAREQDDGTLERAIEENVSLFGTEEHALALAALRG